jgi:integrase/recombinase XerC
MANKTFKEIPEHLRNERLGMAIASVSDVRDRAILEILAGSGLRVSELTGLNLSNIYWDESRLRVLGKGGKTRVVPMSSSTRTCLEGWLKVRRAVEGEQAVFVSTSGTRPGTRMNRRSVEYMVEARLDSHPHMLRHCFATKAVMNDVKVPILQRWLGHADLDTTMVYVYMNDKDSDAEFAAKMA